MSSGIENYLTNQIKEKFTGFIKISFEQGKAKSLSVFNNLENKCPDVPENFNLTEELRKAAKRDFWGTLGLTFVDGEIKSYSFSQIRQGASLEIFLTEFN